MPDGEQFAAPNSRAAPTPTPKTSLGTSHILEHPGLEASHFRPILPRSRHLPVSVTEGSAIENLNKTGVRLWTGCSRDQDGAAGRRDQLDAPNQIGDRVALPDDAKSAGMFSKRHDPRQSATTVSHKLHGLCSPKKRSASRSGLRSATERPGAASPSISNDDPRNLRAGSIIPNEYDAARRGWDRERCFIWLFGRCECLVSAREGRHDRHTGRWSEAGGRADRPSATAPARLVRTDDELWQWEDLLPWLEAKVGCGCGPIASSDQTGVERSASTRRVRRRWRRGQARTVRPAAPTPIPDF
jgi:hypothetical protein